METIFVRAVDGAPTFRDMKYTILVAQNSEDPRTQVGARVSELTTMRESIVSIGWNSLPYQMRGKDVWENSELKNALVMHAEVDALVEQQSKPHFDLMLNHRVMFCTFFPCVECAKWLIHYYVKELYILKATYDLTPPHWKESLDKSKDLLERAGVKIILVDAPPNEFKESIRFAGQTLQL